MLGQAEGSSPDTEAKPVEESDSEPTPKPKPAKRLAKPKGPMAVAKTPKVKGCKLPKSQLLDEPDGQPPRPSLENNCSPTLGCSRKHFYNSISKSPKGTSRRGRPSPATNCIPRLESGLERIAALANNISAAIKAERINILAPVPGRSSVGIEVPNRIKTKVLFRDIVESPEWKKSKAKIPPRWARTFTANRLSPTSPRCRMLIAGATGSGKSVCINSIVASLLFRFSPEELRFVMIDPKVVELQIYNGLPHLAAPVVHDPKKSSSR